MSLCCYLGVFSIFLCWLGCFWIGGFFFLSAGRNAFLTRAWWLCWDGKAYVGLPLNMKTCAPRKELKYVLLWPRAHWMGKWDEHANTGSCRRHLSRLCTFGGNFTLPLIPGLCGQGSGYTFGNVLWWVPLCLGRTWPRCQAEGQGQGHGAALTTDCSSKPPVLFRCCASPLCHLPWEFQISGGKTW